MRLNRDLKKLVKPVVTILLVAVILVSGYFTSDYWFPFIKHKDSSTGSEQSNSESDDSTDTNKTILLTDQAIANLQLNSQPALPQTYWKSIQIPGMVVDRPGISDRGVITPVTGVVTRIHRFPGDSVRPGEPLFSIRLLSESLHATQSDLFRATQDIALAQAERSRLERAGNAIPGARIIEVDNQISRLQVAVFAYKRELANRGLTGEQIDQAAQGEFVSEISVVVPSPVEEVAPLVSQTRDNSVDDGLAGAQLTDQVGFASSITQTNSSHLPSSDLVFEVQDLKVDIGHQVQAGQTICLLANHQLLAIEGRAFRDETLLLERCVREAWPVEVDFQENTAADWPPVDQPFYIRYIANSIDPVNRTFGFRIPLENQARVVNVEGMVQMLWRFRPGQKVRIAVHIERLNDVFVLPSDAVTRDIAEAFVFTQNVNTFERKPVRIIAEDRKQTVLANDGSITPGSFVVQNAADQLNRMTKSQSGDGLPEGYHMHADGSLHKNEDE